jgi:hypothetical protein
MFVQNMDVTTLTWGGSCPNGISYPVLNGDVESDVSSTVNILRFHIPKNMYLLGLFVFSTTLSAMCTVKLKKINSSAVEYGTLALNFASSIGTNFNQPIQISTSGSSSYIYVEVHNHSCNNVNLYVTAYVTCDPDQPPIDFS